MSESLDNYTQLIQTKMNSMFDRQMNRIINDYQDKLREALVDIASGYACELITRVEDYDHKQSITVELRWPNDEAKV